MFGYYVLWLVHAHLCTDLHENSNYILFYRTQSWLPKIFTGKEFGSQISLNIVNEVNKVDDLDKATCGRRPLVVDNLLWKTAFGGDDLRWKTIFSGRWSLVEDDLSWETTFGGKRRWKTTFGKTFNGRWPLVGDYLWQKMTFDGSWPLMEDNIWLWLLPLSVTEQLSPN